MSDPNLDGPLEPPEVLLTEWQMDLEAQHELPGCDPRWSGGILDCPCLELEAMMGGRR